MCHSYGACSSGVERQIVDLVVEGSNPFRHPKNPFNAFVAQPDRATDFESVGRTFESCRTQRKSHRIEKRMQGPLAQLVEQQTLNLWVAGSKPAWLKRDFQILF